MGDSISKSQRNPCEKLDLRSLTEKTVLLQKEINEMMCTREKESRAYERDMVVFALKEAEWERERKRVREEVKRLRKQVEEREESIRRMEDEKVGEKSEKELQLLGASLLMEQMEEERARRDEAVEKWKRLYLAIKTELDDLIDRTHQGENVYWRAEEEYMVDELQREVKAKEETIEVLKAQLATAKQGESNKDREIDILRQSLRIISNKKKTNTAQESKSQLALAQQLRVT